MMKHRESGFPADVVALILHKLPVVSLLRCRVVSKEWHSLITDSRFERNYSINMATDTNPLQLLFIPMQINNRAPVVSHKVDDTSGNCTLISWDHSKYRCMRILGSCNGLVGVFHETKGDIYLFNPCTGKEKHVHVDIKNMKGIVGPWITLCAICYDSSKDEYKAVLCSVFDTFVVNFSHNGTSKLITKNDELPLLFEHDRRKECVGEVVNGVPHWRGRTPTPSLFLFDPQQEEFREMDFPHRGEVGREIFGIGVMRGKLSVALARAAHDLEFDFELIVMEEYGNAESWNLLFVINMSKKMRFFRSYYMTPLLMIEDDRILIKYNRDLWIYNYNHNTMEKLQTEFDLRYFGIISYYPTLASPL